MDPLPRDFDTTGVIGRSPAFMRVLQEAARVAPLDVPVLLTGDYGTGKNVFARLIHENGPRRGDAFVEFNCMAVPESILESELFGQRPGCFCDGSGREGAVARAEHGTLFLDEIAELSPSAQALLRDLLAWRTYRPLGEVSPRVADVRIVAASNADLPAFVAGYRFRSDLYDLLQAAPIRIPSLGERREDIADLADFFCARWAEEYGVPQLRLSPELRRELEAEEWPGNVWQLERTVGIAVLRASGDESARVEAVHALGPPATGAANRVRFSTNR